MQRRSRELFGRDRELAIADEALGTAALGTPQIVLLGGEAGIGKTSLAKQVGARAADHGFTVLTGHCLDIEAGVPLAPVREALRPWLSGRSDGSLRPVTRRLAPYLRAQVTPGEADSASLVEDLPLVLGELAEDAPVMLILEDMHWADRSTQDFAVALARTVRGPLLALLTYRSDEVTRRHPFRRALVEIARSDGAIRMDLGPLDRRSIAAIVREATGTDDSDLVGSLLARSEGNPLFVEELLASGEPGVPEHLGDLLLGRVDRLSPATRALLRLASVQGTRIDPQLLGDAAHLDGEDLDVCLRESLDANVLVTSDEHLSFRHGLIREALYDDLVPDERTRMHAELAAAIQARVEADPTGAGIAEWGPLAFHWAAARALPEAFVASVRAGLAAERFGGSDAMKHLERAVDLWARVPDPERLGGMAKADLFRVLADLAFTHFDADRAKRYIRAALDLVDDESDPLLASRVYVAYAQWPVELSERLSHREALERAVAYAGAAPSAELAGALLAMGRWHSTRDSIEVALGFAQRSVEVAVAAGLRDVESRARVESGMLLVFLGRSAEGIAWLRSGVEVAESAGLRDQALWAQSTLAFNLTMVGEPEAGRALAESACLRALAAGLPMVAAYTGEQAVEAMLNTGAFTEAETLLERLQATGMSEERWRWLRVDQLLARGDVEAAVPLERESMEWLSGRPGGRPAAHAARQVGLFSAAGDAATALQVAQRALEEMPDGDSRLDHAEVTRAAFVALEAAKAHGVAPPEGMREMAAASLERVLGWMTDEWSYTLHAADALEAAALSLTLVGDPAVSEWRAAEAAAERHGAYVMLSPRLGLAAALLAAGERTDGQVQLVDTWQAARTIGAQAIADRAARLARRHRISLPGDDRLPNRLSALTAREREVLDVLATGATNRAIGERLFITEKTASVHVSNLMSKLGVTNRGAAAALARELAE